MAGVTAVRIRLKVAGVQTAAHNLLDTAHNLPDTVRIRLKVARIVPGTMLPLRCMGIAMMLRSLIRVCGAAQRSF